MQGNFDTYQPIRMNEAPKVEGYFVPSTEPPTGMGEPPIPPLAPALCNAIYSATKKNGYGRCRFRTDFCSGFSFVKLRVLRG